MRIKSTGWTFAFAALVGVFCITTAAPSRAAECPVSGADLKKALVKAAEEDTTGLNNNYWGVVVDRSGSICAVAYSGKKADSQWLLSRQIAAAKAFTANGLSLDGAPVATASLYPWVQGSPSGGNPLFGLAFGNPLDASAIYDGGLGKYGTDKDPMLGKRLGGTITFGGGLGLYKGTVPVGGLGLSGDTACADHSTAWRTRIKLKLAPAPFALDFLTFGDVNGHPHCPNDAGTQGVAGD
ncbi:heme-binding protein [Methylopila sp. M107]|uniref:heme-binding protein n=1 Tax=Methylopila sp. M107 TaxID=1101190 RepID=UPI00036F85AB|nr:heme-binding protein [Methylopila sp. M107]